jgi:hypothetical protein
MGIALFLFFTCFVYFAVAKSEVSLKERPRMDSDASDNASALDVLTIATDFIIFTGVLSSVRLGWSDVARLVLVGTTASTGTQVGYSSPASCLLARYGPAERQLFLLGALLLCGPLALSAALSLAKCCGSSWHNLGGESQQTTRITWVVAAVLFQPTITKQTFALLPTVEVDGTSYLANDMSVAVGSSDYHSAIVVAATTIIIFVVGIPLAVLRVLRNPEHRFAPAFAFLFGSFATNKRWWPVTVIWRKTAITAAVSVLTEPWQQLYIATWILALSLVWHMLTLPYKSPVLNTLETKMLSSATFIMACSLAIPIGFGVHGSPLAVEAVIGVIDLGTLAWLMRVALKRMTAEDVRKVKGALERLVKGIAEKCRGRCCRKRSELLEEPLLQGQVGRQAGGCHKGQELMPRGGSLVN